MKRTSTAAFEVVETHVLFAHRGLALDYCAEYFGVPQCQLAIIADTTEDDDGNFIEVVRPLGDQASETLTIRECKVWHCMTFGALSTIPNRYQ